MSALILMRVKSASVSPNKDHSSGKAETGPFHQGDSYCVKCFEGIGLLKRDSDTYMWLKKEENIIELRASKNHRKEEHFTLNSFKAPDN